MASAKSIKDSLIQQLQAKGADVELYRELIDEYCWLWKQEKEMKADIKKRGRTYKAISAAGHTYDKENPSVKNALLFNKQRIAVLAALELSTKTVVGGASKNVNRDLG